MKKPSKRLLGLTLFTGGLLLIIFLATWITATSIKNAAREQCFNDLADEAVALGKNIEQNISANAQQLELIADVADDYEDFTDERLWNSLENYIVTGMLSRLEILLPGDVVITQDGERIDVSGKLSFEEEAAQGEHISDRVEDVTGDGKQVVRHYVPIVRDGETVAMLYGVAVLSDMPELMIDKPYGGQAALYVIDQKTGDFLMDTWHEELGNMWDFSGRQMAAGYSDEALREGVANGESNYVVFVSKTIGSYLYFYYTPINVNSWSVALSVPEYLVLAQANNIGKILNIFLFVEVLCFVVFAIGMFYYARRETEEKQNQITLLNRIYEVERLLFNAHENSDRVSVALQETADILGAEQVSYWMMTQPGYDVSFAWSQPGSAIQQNEFSVQRENAYNLIKYFNDSKSECYQCNGTGKDILEHRICSQERGIRSVLSVPVHDMKSGICGVLTAFNLQNDESAPTLLRSLAVSFGMFCHNMRAYQSVKEQSERDLLTGLYNRNRYQLDAVNCTEWYDETLACVYVDANGLHELNNTHGHAAGDRMLQLVACVLEKYFGDAHTYRIGGDEFVVFAADKPEAEVQQLAAQCEAEVRKAGYYVAVGVEQAREVTSVDALVEAAEQKMYTAKQAFYAEHARRDVR